jgi:hypothetical protein
MMLKALIRALTFCAAALALMVSTGSIARAQTISQTSVGSPVGGVPQGQSFTATLTGFVTQIQVRPRATLSTTLYLYNGAGSGATNDIGTPERSQSVDLVDTGSNTTGLQTIVLAQPLPVVQGQTYAFMFSNSSAFFVRSEFNPYPGGNGIREYNIQDSCCDLVFTVTEVTALPAPVPTLSEWMMTLMGVMLATGAALYIQRRRQTA